MLANDRGQFLRGMVVVFSRVDDRELGDLAPAKPAGQQAGSAGLAGIVETDARQGSGQFIGLGNGLEQLLTIFESGGIVQFDTRHGHLVDPVRPGDVYGVRPTVVADGGDQQWINLRGDIPGELPRHERLEQEQGALDRAETETDERS